MPAPVRAGHTAGTRPLPFIHGVLGFKGGGRPRGQLWISSSWQELSHGFSRGLAVTGLKGNALKKRVSVLIVSIKRKIQYSHEPLLHEMNLILYNFIGSKYFFKVTLHWLSQHDVSSLLGSAPDYPIFCWDLSLRFLSIPLSSNSPLWLLCCPDPCLLAVSVHLQEMMELI